MCFYDSSYFSQAGIFLSNLLTVRPWAGGRADAVVSGITPLAAVYSPRALSDGSRDGEQTNQCRTLDHLSHSGMVETTKRLFDWVLLILFNHRELT